MRIAEINRATKETKITCRVNLDGTGESRIRTSLGFLDHMIDALSKHSGIDIDLTCDGDTGIDDHHNVEDCSLVLGAAINQALGDRAGIARFGFAYAPLDESLARAVLDFSGRPCPVISLSLKRERLGAVACENITHFFTSLAINARACLHIDIIRGDNDHHKSEAAFKALALALRIAVRINGSEIPSTKGVL
ncbi:MAG: imidazoleglycerol-phosphate dehydratase HisB [Phycisphaerales bacterium]